MALFEVLSLDGLTLTGDPTGTLVLEQFSAPPPKQRQEWISAADSEGAALMRSPQHENREITMRIRVGQQASMNAALDQVGSFVDKLAKAANATGGVAMTWTPANSTRTVTFDVLAGEVTDLPIGWDGENVGWFMNRPVLNATITAKPYWRGAEVTFGSFSNNNNPLISLEVTGVTGDVDAIGRLIITDTATQNRRHVEWGLESQFYNASTSLILDSDNLTVTGFAGAQNTRSGAYDPNATGNNVVRVTLFSQNPASPYPTAVVGTGNQSHVGTFRVKARVFNSASETRVRLAWKAGDGPMGSNPWATPPNPGGWSEVDLGLITISPVTSGTQRWTGQVEAYTTTSSGTDALDVDYLLLIPAGEGYGKARATPQTGRDVMVATDQFTGITSGTVLNARVAPAGGTWTTSGATTDFTAVDAPFPSEETVARTTTADTGNGRFAVLGATNYTDISVGVSVQWSGTATLTAAVVARWVDANNWLEGRLVWTGGTTASFFLIQVVAGSATTLIGGPVAVASGQWYALELVAYASGTVRGAVRNAGGTAIAALTATATSVATGGALATGKPGFRDANATGAALSRWYDGFFAAVPTAEPIALYSGRTLEVRSTETVRQDSGGTVYGLPPSYRGSRFLLPTGTSRVAAKATRADIETTSSDFIADNLRLDVAYTPRGIAVPR